MECTPCLEKVDQNACAISLRPIKPMQATLVSGCRKDDIQLGLLRSQSLFQFIQISDEYFEHRL